MTGALMRKQELLESLVRRPDILRALAMPVAPPVDQLRRVRGGAGERAGAMVRRLQRYLWLTDDG